MRVWKPDSIHASARTRCGSTPSRADHASSIARTSIDCGASAGGVATGEPAGCWPITIGFAESMLVRARERARRSSRARAAIAVSVSPERTT